MIAIVPTWRDFAPPICTVCNKPVDSIENMHDIVTLEIVWVVRCHGQSEEARLGQEYIEARGFGGLSFSKAFTAKALPPTQKRLGPG